jgi:hypothetical protein
VHPRQPEPLSPFLTPMVSRSDSPGGFSPGRRRAIALAGASGLAGLAAAIWPWKHSGKGTAPIVSGPTPPRAAETGQTPAAAPSQAVVSDSSVAAERERYARCVGERFRATPEGGGPLELVLESVGPLLTMAAAQSRFEGYSLLFKIPSGTMPDDGMVHLSHEVLGETALFLVTVGNPAAQARCEAVISRAV